MSKKILFTLSWVFVACFWSSAALYINEVNSTGKWIEIYNSGTSQINIGGYSVTRYNNDYSNNTATIPAATVVAAKGFIVLYQEGVDAPVKGAIECLPYGISSDKFWAVELIDKSGKIVDDSFDIGYPQRVQVAGGNSWARVADGGSSIASLEPTPGKSNTSPPEHSALRIFINEVNSIGKWIEIYNDDDQPANIGGFTVVRYNNDGAIAQNKIPSGTTIAAKGFVVLYQGEAVSSPVAGAIDCMTFGISSEKFWNVVLKDNENRLVDNTFNIGNPQTVTVGSGKSWARKTDGNALIEAQEPTPGKPNSSLPERSALKIYVNEVNSTYKWIEIYNDEATAVDISRFTVTRTNNEGSVATAVIPEKTTIAAKGFLVIYQGSTVTAPVPGAIDCLPFGISSDKFMNIVLKDIEGRIVDNTFDIGDPQTVVVNGDKSWARKVDGGISIVAADPTPGKSNTSKPDISDLKLFINEVNAAGKWIEIYNAEDNIVDLSGFSVIRNNNDDTTSYAIIPDKVVIAPKGYVVLYQEDIGPPPVAGAIDCLSFGISATKFLSVILKDALGQLVDTTFDIGNPQTVLVSDDQSWARQSDGDQTIIALTPTPGAQNRDISSNDEIFYHNNALVYGRTLLLPDHTTAIHLYNIAGQLMITNNSPGDSIDLSGLSSGLFVVRMIISGRVVSQKIIL